MKNFIEVTYQGVAYSINVNCIMWFTSVISGEKTSLFLRDNTRLTVDEKYEEIAAKIKEASGKNG